MYTRILVAVDGSKASETALKRAIDLTRAWSAEMRLLHVIDSPYAYPEALYAELSADVEALRQAWHRAGQAVLDRATALAHDADARAEAALLKTNGRRISSVIVDEAKRWRADLIVVATYGRHEEVLLGSVAEDVARKASVSVLLVRDQRAG